MKIASLKFNFLMNLLLTASNFLFPLVTFPYVSRILSPDGTGKVAFASSIVAYFTILASVGVTNYGVRVCAQKRENKDELSKTVQEIMLINLVTMVISYVIYFFLLFSIADLENEKELFLISGLHILFTIIGVEWLYKGLEKYSYITLRSIAFKIISFVLVFTCVKSKDDYEIYAFIIIFATVGSGFVNLYKLKDIIYFKKYTSYEFLKHLKPMFIFFITSLAVSVYVNVSVAMLGFWKGPEEVGYYNAAFRVKDLMVSIVTSLGAVLLPRLSFYIENKKYNEFNSVLSKSMNFIFVLSLPLTIFCILFSSPSILLLAGEDYSNSIIPLEFLAIIIFLVGISNIMGIQMLIPLNKEKLLFYSVALAAVVSIISNYFFIPEFGAKGTAVSAVLSELSIVLIQCVFLREYLTVLFKEISYIKLVFSIGIAIGVTSYFISLDKNLSIVGFLLLSSCFFATYFLSLFLLKERFVFLTLNEMYFKLKRKV